MARNVTHDRLTITREELLVIVDKLTAAGDELALRLTLHDAARDDAALKGWSEALARYHVVKAGGKVVS